MEITQKPRHVLAVITTTLVLFLLFTPVYAATKGYYGLTTVTYDNSISDQGSGYRGWNANYNGSTNPSRSMDQFGLNFWSTYCSCNNVIDYASYFGYSVGDNPWLMQYDKTSVSDVMFQEKVDCGGKVLRGHNHTQHWWQDSGQPGDGGTIDYSKVLTNP